VVLAVSLVIQAGIAVATDGARDSVFAIPVSRNVALAALVATTAGSVGALLFIAAYAAVSIARALRDQTHAPKGFEVIVNRTERPLH
jgi:hypothetical protein